MRNTDNTNHFFRVDRGFVAQTADINGGRTAPMSEAQRVRGAADEACGTRSCSMQERRRCVAAPPILPVSHVAFL